VDRSSLASYGLIDSLKLKDHPHMRKWNVITRMIPEVIRQKYLIPAGQSRWTGQEFISGGYFV
jgi:hypothetical protein